jgi:glycosyltransferase involved in cell wall biosynthesis
MVGLKGQVHMIESVSQLDDVLRKSVEIHFFGDGPELSTLKSLVEEKSIAEQTVFHGMELNRDKVFNCIDILVVCSEQEGLSLAIMEAMARSIPVIATNVGDTPKLVLNEQTGYLYEYGGVDELISYLTELCSDKDTQKRLGMNARAHMIEGFSLEKANDTYQSCYRSKN